MSRSPPSPDESLSAEELLTLVPLGGDVFRSARNQDNRAGMIFGGQPICQALAAAAATVADWPAHNLSASFLRGGKVDRPVDYAVERMRDGRRFAARRVLATQDGEPIFDLLCSFQDPESAPWREAQGAVDVPQPESLVDFRQYVAAQADRLPAIIAHSLSLPFPVELRLVDPDAVVSGAEVTARDYWFRVPSAAGIADARSRQCLLAFASDYWLAGAAGSGAGGPGLRARVASLNHSLWFHRPVDVSDWLLYRTRGPWAAAGRGLAHGEIFDRDGRLVASATQEISLRWR